MNKKQKICLWAGVGIMDLAGTIILYDRVKRYRLSRVHYVWSTADVIVLLILIAITTATVFYSLKDEQKQ